MVFARYKLLTFILLISLAAGVAALAKRHAVEARNRTVEIAVDFDEIEALASATGQPIEEVLSRFRKAGATSVAVQEMTINDLIQNGQAAIVEGPAVNTSWLNVTAPRLWEQVPEYLDAAMPRNLPSAVPAPEHAGPGGSLVGRGVWTKHTAKGLEILVRGNVAYVRTIPVGLPPDVSVIRQQNLAVVARLVNYPGIITKSVAYSLWWLKRAGVQTVIFGGDQVLGFRSLIPEVATGFKANNLYYGAIEFSKQKGDAKLSEELAAQLVRVHSIPAAELPILDMPSAVERYVRAVKERNIRLLYVRLFDTGSPNPIGTNAEYIDRIRRGIEAEGFTVGQVRPMGDPGIPKALVVVLAAGCAAGVVLVLGSVIELRIGTQAVFWGLGFLFLAAIAAGLGDLGRKAVALAAAVVFPTLAVIFAGQTPPRWEKRSVIVGAIGRFLLVTAITVSGGVIIASLLATRDFMLKLDQFMGVKLAQILPILILAAAYAAQVAWTRDTWQEQKRKAKENLRKLFGEQVLVWQIAASLTAIVLVAVVLARSGNEPGVGVPPLELKFRALLDQVLFVRPRTKEFLFGHPAMIVALGLLLAGRQRWAIPLLVLGTIGQVSVLNTFCHIHTPVTTSLLRVAVGAVIGSIFGAAALRFVVRAGIPPKKAEAE